MSRFTDYLSLTLLTGVCAFAGCAPDERMMLSDCDYGLYWADCGGNDYPIFGCDRGNGACRWFSGGETARGYAVADGAVTVRCPDGWPFSDFEPTDSLRERVVDQMNLLSTAPIARAGEHDLSVTFDLAPPFFSRCSAEGCIGSTFVPVQRLGSAIVVTFFGPNVRERWELEIVLGSTRGDWVARLYRTETRFRDSPIALTCGDSFGRQIITSGVLHLNTDDVANLDAFHGRLDVVEESSTVTFQF